MKKEMRLKAIKELIKEFETLEESTHHLKGIYRLLDADFIPNDADVYEVNTSSYSKSMIDGWTSHTEETKYYNFYSDLIKEVNGKIVTEWVKINHDNLTLLLKLYRILKDEMEATK